MTLKPNKEERWKYMVSVKMIFVLGPVTSLGGTLEFSFGYTIVSPRMQVKAM
jgi:hypothetical protein